MSAFLITPEEVSSIAFVNALDPALILPIFISSAESKYIVPIVTQVIITDITIHPDNYTTLVNDYIKPYLAFSVKYTFYNQLLTETDTFPTSDQQRAAAIQEVMAIMEVSRGLLSKYLNANIFETPVVPVKKLAAGFLKSKGQMVTASNSNLDITRTLAGAPTGIPSDNDTFNFINFATGLLNKINVSAIKAYFDAIYGTPSIESHTFHYENINSESSYSQFYLFINPKYAFRILSVAIHSTSNALTFSVAHSESYVEGLARCELIAGVLEFNATGNNVIPINTSLLAVFNGIPVESAAVTLTLSIQRI